MTKKPEDCSPHGWTTDTLETYLSAEIAAAVRLLREHEERNKERFASSRAEVETALKSAEKAVSKAEVAAEHRFDSLNNVREREKEFIRREEYRVEHGSLLERIDKAENSITELMAKNAVAKATPLMVTSLIGTALSVLMFAGLFLMFFIHIKETAH